MQETPATFVSYATLAFAGIGACASALTALWAILNADREVFDLHLDWQWNAHPFHGEMPVIYVHNRSKSKINIVSLSWLSTNLLVRIPVEGTAKFFEDPSDLQFPYCIEPGDYKALLLDNDGAMKALKYAGIVTKALRALGSHRVELEVVTMRGKRKRIAADSALPWLERNSRD